MATVTDDISVTTWSDLDGTPQHLGDAQAAQRLGRARLWTQPEHHTAHRLSRRDVATTPARLGCGLATGRSARDRPRR